MGIHGIYKDIGHGRRVALSKLAADKFQETGRPMRLAIDTSIWLFQIQASKGGTNPALRTFYYRLLRLISLSIHPVFVFDGPNRPPFKRNKRTGPNVASIPEFLAKQLLKQFGFPIHLAPGEAEAECALLQREGIVDAVLSEDVDTIMFGSGVTIRNWSPEQNTSKTPTHVNVYDAVDIKKGPSGLDREGMILVALMSGGDYVPEGIPGCGPKSACDAARANCGHDLCRIPGNDKVAMKEWRERLQHELSTNGSKFFKTKRPSLKIPDDFPRMDILGYYTRPVISTQAGLTRLKESIRWDQNIDFPGLRDFARDAFDWVNLEGAKHFVRSLAPSLLVRHLRMQGEQNATSVKNGSATREGESQIVKGIHGTRRHAVTDHTSELRVGFIPIELVQIDLSGGDPEDSDSSLSGPQAVDPDVEDEIPLDVDDDAEGPKKRGPTKFDPHKMVRAWILESFVKAGVPLKFNEWETGQRTKRSVASGTSKPAPRARAAKKTKATKETGQVTIDQFAKVTKLGTQLRSRCQKPDTSSSCPDTNVIELLSSSPVHPSVLPALRSEPERALSKILKELPASVNKRRRTPMQRSQTLPTSHSKLDRAITPSLDEVESLDLVSPSPLRVPLKKAKRNIGEHFSVATITQNRNVAPSPGKVKQTTLDNWRSPRGTPTKARRGEARATTANGSPSRRRPQATIASLDLTLSSPPLQNNQPLTKTHDRPPRQTIKDVFANSRARTPLGDISLPGQALIEPPPQLLGLTRVPSASPIRTRNLVSPLASRHYSTLDLTLASSPPPLRSPSPVSKSSPNPPFAPTSMTRKHIIIPYSATSTLDYPPNPPTKFKKRYITLRDSLPGAWTFIDADSDLSSPAKPAASSSDNITEERSARVKARIRRQWRESEVLVMDLT